MRRRQTQFLAVFRTVRRATFKPCPFNLSAMAWSDSGLRTSSWAMIFATASLTASVEMLPPSAVCRPPVKKNRSSKTPCGVRAYLPATARPTVVSCTPIFSATAPIVIGFSFEMPCSKKSPCAAAISSAMRRIVVRRWCRLSSTNWPARIFSARYFFASAAVSGSSSIASYSALMRSRGNASRTGSTT